MRDVLWRYRCDHGHEWSVREDQSGVEPDPGRCPEGSHVPVYGRREPWADRVAFSLVPAARVVDKVRGSVVDDGQFFLEVRTLTGELIGATVKPLSLADAVSRVNELSRATEAEAGRKASRLGFLSEGRRARDG
jgi:hypothetical protein